MAKHNFAKAEELATRIGTLVGTELAVLKEETLKQTTSGLSLWRAEYSLVSEHGIIISGTLAEVLAALVGIAFVGTEAIVMFSDPVK